MKYDQLLQAVQSAAGLRLRLRLQPLYGPDQIVFPPTFAGGGYLISLRRIPEYRDYVYHKEDGDKKTIYPRGSVPCAIMDSVQSQANRMEAALVDDIRSGNLKLPHAVTDFSGINGPGSITSLEAPHRIFDAIIRDSELDGIPFPYTAVGKAVVEATSNDATALFRYDPTSLLFGCWDSTGVSGGLGEKFTRCVVSELVAVNVEQATRKGTRVDPLNCSANVNIKDIQKQHEDKVWAALIKKGENPPPGKSKKDMTKASSYNHGNIIWPEEGKPDTIGGVHCDYVSQSTTISFAALRQLRFPIKGKAETDPCAHAVLAAIGLHSVALNLEKGWHLRSRCDLVPEDGAQIEWELLGNSNSKFTFDSKSTRDLVGAAIQAAKQAGLPWEDSPLSLKPSKSLVELVQKSREREGTTKTN